MEFTIVAEHDAYIRHRPPESSGEYDEDNIDENPRRR